MKECWNEYVNGGKNCFSCHGGGKPIQCLHDRTEFTCHRQDVFCIALFPIIYNVVKYQKTESESDNLETVSRV